MAGVGKAAKAGKSAASAAAKTGQAGKGVLELDATKILWIVVSALGLMPLLILMALALLVIVILMAMTGSLSTQNPDPNASGSMSPVAESILESYGGDGQHPFDEPRVPDPYWVAPMKEASGKCATLSPVIMAAQIDYASGWRSSKVGPGDRKGMSQLPPEVWEKFGKNESKEDDEDDEDDDNDADPLDPEDNFHAHARWFCHLAKEVEKLMAGGDVAGDKLTLTLMAWDEGLEAVEEQGGYQAVDFSRYPMGVRQLFAGYVGNGKVTLPPSPSPTSEAGNEGGGNEGGEEGGNEGGEGETAILARALSHINAARTAEGLKPLTLDAGLSRAAAVHTRLMIDGCGLEHQCPGEAGLGERISAQNVTWSGVGENIGLGSSGASEADQLKTADGLTDSMLAEVPPEDGHRRNLLNPGFGRIGLSVIRDDEGITWLTQDFAN